MTLNIVRAEADSLGLPHYYLQYSDCALEGIQEVCCHPEDLARRIDVAFTARYKCLKPVLWTRQGAGRALRRG